MKEASRRVNEDFNTTELVRAKKNLNPRILVVEDDVTFEPYWTAIAEKADRNAHVSWATSEIEAENMILDAIESGQKFDLVITDIFLSGSRTGIDLWDKFYQSMNGRIIVTSGIEFQKFVQYFSKSEIQPLYLQKPLVAHDCIGAIYNALHEQNY